MLSKASLEGALSRFFPSPSWKYSQKWALSLSKGTLAKGSLQALATRSS